MSYAQDASNEFGIVSPALWAHYRTLQKIDAIPEKDLRKTSYELYSHGKDLIQLRGGSWLIACVCAFVAAIVTMVIMSTTPNTPGAIESLFVGIGLSGSLAYLIGMGLSQRYIFGKRMKKCSYEIAAIHAKNPAMGQTAVDFLRANEETREAYHEICRILPDQKG